MPNPKTGTVTADIAKAVREIKAGKVEFRVDKTGIIHAPVGKASFASDSLVANAHALVESIVKAKPAAAKGKYLKSVTVSSTMGPGIRIDTTHIDRRGEALMAVTTSRQGSRAPAAGGGLQGIGQRDPRGLQGAERPAGHRAAASAPHAKASYKVVKNTLARRALKGTASRRSGAFFVGTTAVAYTATDPVALAKTLTTFAKTAPTLTIKAAVVQGRAIKAAEVTELAALPGKPELLREAAVRAAGADGADRQRAERRAARSDECVGAGGEEAEAESGLETWH